MLIDYDLLRYNDLIEKINIKRENLQVHYRSANLELVNQ